MSQETLDRIAHLERVLAGAIDELAEVKHSQAQIADDVARLASRSYGSRERSEENRRRIEDLEGKVRQL